MVLSVTLDAAKCDLDFLELLPVSLHVRIVHVRVTKIYTNMTQNYFLKIVLHKTTSTGKLLKQCNEQLFICYNISPLHHLTFRFV